MVRDGVCSLIRSFILWINTDAKGKPKSLAPVVTSKVPANSTKWVKQVKGPRPRPAGP